MTRRLAVHILIGAVALEALAVAAYFLLEREFTTGISSPVGPWWPVTFPAFLGAFLGALTGLALRSR
jgi:hypothetical protein